MDTHMMVPVRVSFDQDKLKLEIMDRDHQKPIENSPTIEANPVVLSSVSLDLVLKLMQLTGDAEVEYGRARCMMGEQCHGARYEHLDWRRTALITRDHLFNLELMCRKCYLAAVKADPRMETPLAQAMANMEMHDVPIVLLKGWDLPPNAAVSIWNSPPARAVNGQR